MWRVNGIDQIEGELTKKDCAWQKGQRLEDVKARVNLSGLENWKKICVQIWAGQEEQAPDEVLQPLSPRVVVGACSYS